MTNDRAKRRPRRIASDEAHSWARNLRLDNVHAKLVLMMLALYVDAEGACYVGIPTLAEDCELSPDTVRRRLSWLEEIGAIVRIPQWIDEHGRRNGDVRGKRSTDLIKLLYESDTDEIEARASGAISKTAAASTPFSPSQQQGLNDVPESVSPRSALGQPSHCSEGLISEPEPESSPKPPSRGLESENDFEGLSEPEHFAEFWQGYPGHEAMVAHKAQAVAQFAALPVADRIHARAAALLYGQAVRKDKIRPLGAHKWLAAKGWAEYPNAKLGLSSPVRTWISDDRLVALNVASRIADRPPPRTVVDPERGRGLWRLGEFEPDLAALSEFDGQPPDDWLRVDQGSPQFAAWRDRLQAWLGGEVQGDRVWLEPYDPVAHDLPANRPGYRFRKSVYALRVPAPWPPRRDGTWPASGEGDAT